MLCVRSANTTAMYGRVFHISARDCETHPSRSDYRRYDRLAEVDISRVAACSSVNAKAQLPRLCPHQCGFDAPCSLTLTCSATAMVRNRFSPASLAMSESLQPLRISSSSSAG
jgi:hypothetical protein